MVVWKSALSYLKRGFGNYIIIPILIAGPLFQTFLMHSNMSSLTKSISAGITASHTEIIVLGNIQKANIDQLVAATTLAYFLMLTGLVMVGLNVSDRKNNTLMRIFSTPARKLFVILGGIAAQAAITFVIAAAYMLLSKLFFNINWGASILGLIVVTTFSVYISVAFSFLMACLFKNPKAAVGAVTFLLFFMAMISDSFSLGGQFDGISKFTINKWIYDGYYALMQGNGLESATRNLAVLGLMGTVLIILASILYRRERTYE